MSEVTQIGSRKADHIRINLEEDVRSALTTGLERYRFIHRALPELNLDAIALGQTIFGRPVDAPILISSMTGGAAEAAQINRTLAQAAQQRRIAIGVGSQRAAIQHPELAETFQMRRFAPDVLLFANLGAIQLNYGFGLDECRQAVEMIEADALILHFNALQEAVQPEGDTRFAGLLAKVEQVCQALSVPVIAKEVGWGFSKEDVWHLKNAGVAGIDVAGAGGTSWSQVEMHRAKTDSQRRLAAAFIDWGIPTAEALRNVAEVGGIGLTIASGGLRSGVDVAKCLALGARLGGLAGPFLKAAAGGSVEQVLQVIDELRREIQVCLFACGAPDIDTLQNGKFIKEVDR
jgi:isopentenyl-diphosphate delta-isomerase